nr:unnamed protein product [Callosobruchus analis]
MFTASPKSSHLLQKDKYLIKDKYQTIQSNVHTFLTIVPGPFHDDGEYHVIVIDEEDELLFSFGKNACHAKDEHLDLVLQLGQHENYSLKYAEEIQSFHFGGARQQVTLHTVVVYSKAGSDTVPKSYCTLSESLYHGPTAIWAHLHPIVKEYTQNDVDVMHFLSDSPVTQYSNKQMFSFITNQFMEHFPKVKSISWNYHEAGHGKGAPDGIGGVCKRTADRVVAQGKDISNFESLVNVLKEACPVTMKYHNPYSNAKTGDYVLVYLESINKKLAIQYRYVAVCQSDFKDSEIKVAYLKLCDCQNGDLFKLGEENGVSYVQEDQILELDTNKWKMRENVMFSNV